MRPFLALRRVEVESLRGVRPRDAFAVSELSPVVNVVFGPNGIGKSTLAHAIQAAMWPSLAPASALVRATFRSGEEEGEVALAHGAAQWKGLTAPASGPRERSRYYRLSLEEMVRDDVGDVAERVRRLLAGGLDLAAAASPWSAAFSDPVTELQALRRADDELQRARRAEVDVYNASVDLPDHRRRLAELEERLATRESLTQARDYAERRRQARALRLRHRAFDPRLARIAGTEATELDGLQRARHEQTARVTQALRQLARTPDDGTPLPAPMPELQRNELQRRAADMGAMETRVAEALRNEGAAREGLRARLRGVGDEFGILLDATDLEPLRGLRYAELAQRLRETEAARAQAAAFETLRHHLNLDESVPDGRTLDEAINALQAWLSSPTPSEAARPAWAKPAAIAGIVVAVVGMGLASSIPFLGTLLAEVGAGLAGYGVGQMSRPGPVTNAGRDEAAARFGRLGVAPPTDWSTEPTQRRLRELQEEQARAVAFARRQALWEAKAPDWERAQAEIERRESEAEALRVQCGFAPTVDAASLARLFSLLDGIFEQAATLAEAEEAHRRAGAELQASRDRFNAITAPYACPPIDDARSAESTVALLAQRSAATETLTAAQRRCEEIDGEIAALFRRIGLDPGDDATLRRLTAEQREYLKVTESRRACVAELRASRRHIDAAFRDGSLERLAEALDGLSEAAAARDALRDTIAQIESRVADAKEGRSVEDALARRQGAVEVLAADRDAQIRSAVGRMLADFVGQESRQKEMPAVFRNAARLFGEITLGRYELRYEGDQFRAVETRDWTVRPLNELSAGTRVQLLLAVRLGFLEEDEAVRLPLLLDETLATSDVDRARAVIQAVGRLAAMGRQVFYFTAQREDAARWESILAEEGIEVGVVDLGQVRGQAASARLVAPVDLGVRLPKLPRPEGLAYSEYGRLLDVPPRIDPYAVGATHLWHLMEPDLDALYRLLYMGRETWGQVKGEGASLVPTAWPSLSARGRAAEIAAEIWMQGRPAQRIDRDVLLGAGLTAAQAEGMRTTLAVEAEDPLADGNRLYARLDRKVSTEQVGTRRKVQEHLTATGLADLREALDADGVLREALRRVVEDPATEALPREEVERLVRAMELPYGAAV
ncbi:MAG: hypothetical protein ACO1SV_02120 [Fimbriimonas sp.]